MVLKHGTRPCTLKKAPKWLTLTHSGRLSWIGRLRVPKFAPDSDLFVTDMSDSLKSRDLAFIYREDH